MITQFFKALFGGSSEEKTAEKETQPVQAQDENGNAQFSAQTVMATTPEELCDFVDYIVRGLVDAPDDVKIVCDSTEPDTRHIRIHCAKDDVGKVVGKRGKTIIAIRALANSAAGRIKQRITLEVAD